MANTVKSLAAGQLPTTKGTLYTAPAVTATIAKTVKLHNTSGSTTEAVIIYHKLSAGTSKIIAKISLSPGWSAEVDEIFLSTGDLIEGSSTNATTVDYSIGGMEQT